ncbi:hypothetical protein AB0467_22650 [Streptomyces sp. NPDC052095]
MAVVIATHTVARPRSSRDRAETAVRSRTRAAVATRTGTAARPRTPRTPI